MKNLKNVQLRLNGKKNIARVCESIEWINQIQQIIVLSRRRTRKNIKMYAPDSFDAESIKGGGL